MSSTTMSTAHLQTTRHALPLSDKDTPSYPDSRRTASPPSPSSTPTPKLAASIPDKSEKSSSYPTSPKTNNVESDEKDDTKDKIIDMETFQQILDLDEEDDDREFSRGMVEAYFDQASQTFEDMDIALKEKNLEQLSSLGHFLKGSSAALGVSKVKDSCEKLQHYGQRRDEMHNKDLSKAEALDMIEELLVQVKEEYSSAEQWLKTWLAGLVTFNYQKVPKPGSWCLSQVIQFMDHLEIRLKRP